MDGEFNFNDIIVYNSYFGTPRRYAQMIKDQFDQLLIEGSECGTVMCIPLHAYAVGHPHRIKGFEEALEYIQSDEYVEVTPSKIRLRKVFLKEHERKRAQK